MPAACISLYRDNELQFYRFGAYKIKIDKKIG